MIIPGYFWLSKLRAGEDISTDMQWVENRELLNTLQCTGEPQDNKLSGPTVNNSEGEKS